MVLPDVNLDQATEGAVVSAFWNTGQDCTAATRVYVHESIHDKFVSMLVKKTQKVAAASNTTGGFKRTGETITGIPFLPEY